MTPGFATAIHAIGVELDGAVVVVDMRDGGCLALNPAAARIWRGLERELGPDEIASDLASHFGIDAARAAADVASLVAGLKARGLLNQR